jgi:uncharacterized protein (TIGR00369 family)
VTNDERRIAAASLLRELGHEFVARNLSDEQLDELVKELRVLRERLTEGEPRVREFSRDRLEEFSRTMPTYEEIGERQLFADSVVAGAANPMGLNAQLWRDGDVGYMRVTLGRAFEGAPGRAHGGIVAALLDEAMGLMNVIDGAMAVTATLDITYHAPTPLGEPIVARAWIARSEGRKRYVEATVHAQDVLVASAKGLFITIDRSTILEQMLITEE